MNFTKLVHGRHFHKRPAKGDRKINLYPLLGLLLVVLAAVLGYGAMYFLLSA